MKTKKIICAMIVISFLYAARVAYALVVGSNTAVSRQALIVFPATEVNNSVLGFAELAGGFFLTDTSTTFTFNSYFPVNVIAGFNGGTCFLARGMTFGSGIDIATSGTIGGNFQALEFTPRADLLYFPSAGSGVLFDHRSTGTIVYSVDWNQTDSYLLVGTAVSTTIDELQVFYWDKSSLLLTPTASFNANLNMYQVAWQPGYAANPYCAAATSAGVRTYQFSPESGLMSAVSSANTTVTVNAVSWAPSGTYLAIGKNSTTIEVTVYAVSAGVLSSPIDFNITPNASVQRSAIAWDNTGQFLAVGTSTNPQLRLLFFNGTTLTSTQSINAGATVQTVAWSHDGSLLAVGLAGGSNRIRIYRFDGSTLTEQVSYRNGETQTVYNISWNPDDSSLAYVRATGVNFQVRGCKVARSTGTLVLVAQGTLTGSGYGVSWSKQEGPVYVATGDVGTNVSVWGYREAPFVFYDTDIVFNGPIEITESMIFNGQCSVTSNGNLINVNNNSIILNPGATLTVYNSILYGMGGGQSVQFLDTSSSSIFLAQTQIINTRDFTLHGPLFIDGEVLITGTYKFIYRTDKPSYVMPQAHLCFDSGVTFSYDPISGDPNLLVLTDPSSELYLYETSTYITPTMGLALVKGLLTVDGDCPLCGAGPLYLGDGTTANNVTLNVLPDSGIQVHDGSLVSCLTS